MYKHANEHINWREAIRTGIIVIALACVGVSLPISALAQENHSGTLSQTSDDHVIDTETTVLAQSRNLSVLQDGDWILWQYAMDLGTDSNSRIYYGTKHELGGCSYSGTDIAAYPSHRTPSNQLAPLMLTIERQIAEQLKSCTMITEYNVLTIDEAIDKDLLLPSELNEIQHLNDNDKYMTKDTADLPLKGSIKVYYEDPPQIDVTSVTTEISWSTKAGCIDSTYKASYWGWFSNSGWQRKEFKSNTEPDLCDEAWKNTYGKYKNEIFCLFIDTWTELSATYVVHDGGTAVKASWDVDKWGGCTFLLSFHKHFIHPW